MSGLPTKQHIGTFDEGPLGAPSDPSGPTPVDKGYPSTSSQVQHPYSYAPVQYGYSSGIQVQNQHICTPVQPGFSSGPCHVQHQYQPPSPVTNSQPRSFQQNINITGGAMCQWNNFTVCTGLVSDQNQQQRFPAAQHGAQHPGSGDQRALEPRTQISRGYCQTPAPQDGPIVSEVYRPLTASQRNPLVDSNSAGNRGRRASGQTRGQEQESFRAVQGHRGRKRGDAETDEWSADLRDEQQNCAKGPQRRKKAKPQNPSLPTPVTFEHPTPLVSDYAARATLQRAEPGGSGTHGSSSPVGTTKLGPPPTDADAHGVGGPGTGDFDLSDFIPSPSVRRVPASPLEEQRSGLPAPPAVTPDFVARAAEAADEVRRAWTEDRGGEVAEADTAPAESAAGGTAAANVESSNGVHAGSLPWDGAEDFDFAGYLDTGTL